MTAGTTPTGRARMLGLALLAATFLVGALAGAAFDRLLIAGPVREAATPLPAADRAAKAPKPGHRDADLFDQLELTADQRSRIDAILERRRAEMEAFWEEEGQRLRAVVDSARGEIRALLSPDQLAEYERLRKERRKQRDHSCARDDKTGGERKS